MKLPADGTPQTGCVIMPPPSVSKAGYMTEITTGTRQLAKAGVQGMKKRRKKAAAHGFMLPLEMELEEFGTGLTVDAGRNKELLSSPREDMQAAQRLQTDAMINKEKAFHRTMELRYNAEGDLIEEPDADPIDLKYSKYNVRRPWSSKSRATTCTPVPVPVPLDSGGKTPEELEEARMLAILEGCGSDEEKSSSVKMSTFYLTKLPRSTDCDVSSTQPCIGQYNPRYKIVHRTPCKPPDWGRASHKTQGRSKRPKTAQGGKVPPSPPPAAVPHASPPEDKPAAQETEAKETATVGEATRRHPAEYGKWVERSRSALSYSKMPRPSSAFLSTERKPPMKSSTPDTYWPYNHHFPTADSAVEMSKQQGRWEAACGYQSRTEAPPDVVYDTHTPAAVHVATFSSQTPRSGVRSNDRALTPASHTFYDTNPGVLSSFRKVQTMRFDKGPPRGTGSKKADTRKALQVSYAAVSPKAQGGVNYDTQVPRAEYLSENPNVHLEYDAKHTTVARRTPATHMDWTDGHNVFKKTSDTAELNYNPTDAVIRRHSPAPHMMRGTSRKHNFGAFVPLQMLDQVYDARGQGSAKHCGLKFEKQVGREKRERALKQKLVRSDMFYDLPQERIQGAVAFERHLARHKRGPTKLKPTYA